jgi:hypothetical protein
VPFDAREIHGELLISGLDADSLVGVLPPFCFSYLSGHDKDRQSGASCFLYAVLRV